MTVLATTVRSPSGNPSETWQARSRQPTSHAFVVPVVRELAPQRAAVGSTAW
jgi:hypothetical protein